MNANNNNNNLNIDNQNISNSLEIPPNLNLEENNGAFATGVNIIGQKKEVILPPIRKQTPPKHQQIPTESSIIQVTIDSPTFFEKAIPEYNPNFLSLTIPVDLSKIKRNALNSIGKVKFNHFVQNAALNELMDALISDGFWFIVGFFQNSNENLIEKEDDIRIKKIKISNRNEKKLVISSILRRMSTNYFKFFIRVCDMGPSRKNDPALNAFRDFISQCVFYSIYLAFPKSRHLFNEDFRNRIVFFFAYLFNGLTSENTFAVLHWELDLGKGNIIENNFKYKEDEHMKLPTLNELQQLLEKIYNRKKFLGENKRKKRKFRDDINSDILNTPLYRLYAETNKFETLNLVKPIKMSNRKIIDIYSVNKQHAAYLKNARDTIRNVHERKIQYKKEIAEKEKEFQNQINEVKENENRIKKELANIKIQNVQEYANYCIFISSK
jgi:hypothetical protein